jgi:hypothetical protein
VKLELLSFDGCPNRDTLVASLRELASARGVEFAERRIETPEQAERIADRQLGLSA